MAGVKPATPGFKHIHFQPQPGGSLTSASATYESLYGTIASNWQITNDLFTLTVTVPVNTTATVVIPARLGRRVTMDGQAVSSVPGVTQVQQNPDATLVEIGSGNYTFQTLKP